MFLNKKFKVIFSGLLMILLYLTVAQAVLASGVDEATKGLKKTATDGGFNMAETSTSLPTIIGKVVGVGLSLIGVVFFLLILYAGFTWMTAMGKEEKVTEAKEMIFAAAIGLIVVLGAYAITNLIARIFVDATGGA